MIHKTAKNKQQYRKEKKLTNKHKTNTHTHTHFPFKKEQKHELPRHKKQMNKQLN